MAATRAGYSASLLVLAAVAVLCCAETTAASIHAPVSESLLAEAAEDHAAMTEFLEDSAFWSAVDTKVGSKITKPEQHGHPIIEVAEKDVATATQVALTAEAQEAQAEAMCLKAKHDVRGKAAGSSKAKRQAAVAQLKKFCKHIRHVVTQEVEQDVQTLAGKHTAKAMVEATMRHSKTTAEAEKAYFKEHLGHLNVTGTKAKKMAEDEATANALKQMADKSIKADKKKADDACAKVHEMAKKLGGQKTEAGRKKTEYAIKFCAKMKKVMGNERALIKKDVQDTAEGKSSPGQLEGHIAKSVGTRQVADGIAKADAACDDAMKQANAVPPPAHDKAMAMAKAMCQKVKAVVAKEAAAVDKVAAPESQTAAVASAMKAKAEETCQHAKDMAHKMTKGHPEHADVANAMAKSLCDKVNKVVQKNIQKIEDAPVVVVTPGDATPQDESTAAAQTDAAVKTLEGKAKDACDHAMGMASKIASAGDLVKGAVAKTMAKKLCDKVRGVVKMEIKKAAKVQKAVNKVQDGGADALVPEHVISEDAGKDAVVPEDDAPATAVGHMPASVVKELEHDVATVHASEKANEAKAARLCAMAKSKIRNESGGGSDAERKHSVEIAMNFCHINEATVEKQEVDDNKQLGALARMEAKKYGLKAVKMNKKTSKGGASDAEIVAERKLFHERLGYQGDHATDKVGLKDAQNEALKQALGEKVTKAKAQIDAHVEGQATQVHAACKKAKASILSVKDAAKRMARLDKALKFCKKAKKILAVEKKTDYASLDKIKAEVEAKNRVGSSTPTQDAAVKVAEGAMSAKATAMCTEMKEKAKKISTKQALNDALMFCKKTKALLAKQGIDTAIVDSVLSELA